MPTQKDPTYCSWIKMRTRCKNPRNDNYQYYGGAGVKVCELWDSFQNFLADMGERPSRKHSIDRIDPSGNYEPGNCRWATVAEQNRNKKSVRRLRVGGAELISKDIAFITGKDRTHITKLARNGMTLEQVLAKFGFEIVPVSKLTATPPA